MKNTLLLFLFSFLLLSCEKSENTFTQAQSDPEFVVSKVYDYQGNLLADYTYDENWNLQLREFSDPLTGNSSDLVFYYENNLLSQIDYIDYDFPQFSHTRFFFYNSGNQIIRSEVHQNDEMLSHINYEYYDNGLLQYLYEDDSEPFSLFEYDEALNLYQHTGTYSDPWTGEEGEFVYNYTYDDGAKASFNLDYLASIDLLPRMGSEAGWQRNLSCNNITLSESSGTQWLYEYNEHDLPSKITTIWDGIETKEPIELNLEYVEVL